NMPEIIPLDAKDRRILAELDFNARISDKGLARKLRISRDSARYRVKGLEEKGIIKKYFIVASAPLRGLVSVKVMIKFLQADRKTEEEIFAYLQSIKEVGWIVETDGAFDLIFVAWHRGLFEFERFYGVFLEKFGQAFLRREIAVITEHHVYNRKYLSADSEPKEAFYGGEPSGIIDGTDAKIINALKENSRMRTIEISRLVGLTPEAVRYRLEKLVENRVLLGFRAMIDLEKIGCQYYNVLLKLKSTSVLPSLIGYCKMQKNITYASRYLGEYDLGIDIEVQSPAQFRALMKDIREKFGESLLNYDYVQIYKEWKISY
ncbi:MAG: winged helix-turn-helix transcriptional regulator, partial [Candidatus Diapherotrites archaeon]|nr:winged helix-turn-helix transcriptional regulator [Candidatus Diapherotrites archaeon]